VVANETHNTDLLWALKGGGPAGLGVITELKVRVATIPSSASGWWYFNFTWPADQAENVFTFWQTWAPQQLAAFSYLRFVPPTTSSLITFFEGYYEGNTTEASLATDLTGFFAIGAPESFIFSLNYTAGAQNGVPSRYKVKSFFGTQSLSSPGYVALQTFLSNSELKGTPSAEFLAFGGAINNVANDATAFVHRAGTLWLLQFSLSWLDPASDEANLNDLSSLYNSLLVTDSFLSMDANTYQNYVDLGLEDFTQSYYGSNLVKLRSVKTQQDPENFFKSAQSV